MVHVRVTLLCAALIGVLGAAFMMKGGDSQRFHCKEAGWTRFQNSCGIVLEDLEPPHYFLMPSGINKVCRNGEVPRDCGADITEYIKRFDPCPLKVRSEDPNWSTAKSMQSAVDNCSLAVRHVVGAAAVLVMVINTIMLAL